MDSTSDRAGSIVDFLLSKGFSRNRSLVLKLNLYGWAHAKKRFPEAVNKEQLDTVKAAGGRCPPGLYRFSQLEALWQEYTSVRRVNIDAAGHTGLKVES